MDKGDGGYHITPLVAAAHELKAPLALVRQLALRLEEADITDEERSRLLRQTIITSERALRLTSDLTKVTRLDDALFGLEPINPEQLCQDVVNELTPMFEAYRRRITVSTRKHPLLLVANRDLLRRILLNFGDNALHYSLPGTAVDVQIKALKRAGTIRIGIRDYGPALSGDMWRQLQQRLLRAPQPINARPQSSGLGLFIAQQFADIMHGHIGAIRHKDGATFYVELQASSQLRLL